MTDPVTLPREELDAFDAGLLSDAGGGDGNWWQDYIRNLLASAHDHYAAQFDSLRQSLASAPLAAPTCMNRGGDIDPLALGCLVPGCTSEMGVACRSPQKDQRQ